jgi:hypothetical protein
MMAVPRYSCCLSKSCYFCGQNKKNNNKMTLQLGK